MSIRREHRIALALAAAGGLSITVYAATGLSAGVALLAAAPAAPLAVLCMVWGRVRAPFPRRALLVGMVVAPAVALVTHPAVAAFMAVLVAGFGDSGRHLLDALRIDPRLTTVLGSPWVLVVLADLAVVAPLTEEAGKALAALAARPRTRRDAFLAGVAAGAGFAVVENLLYVGGTALAGGLWPVVALSRVAGAAAHPLAGGLVMLGWWEWRHGGGVARLLRGYGAGVAVHAVWNGTLVSAGVVVAVLATGPTAGAGLPVAFTAGAVLGAAMLAALWWVAGSASAEGGLPPFALRGARSAAAVVLIGSALLVPLVVLVVNFPAFYRPAAAGMPAPAAAAAAVTVTQNSEPSADVSGRWWNAEGRP